jgi:hypothetical protein
MTQRRQLEPRAVDVVFRSSLLALVYLLTSAFVLDAFMRTWGFRGDHPRFGFERLLDHTADRPFVYRVLSPWIIETAASQVPERVVERAEDFLLRDSTLLRYRFAEESWSVDKSLRWHMAYAYLLAAMLATLGAMRWLGRIFFPGCGLFTDYAPVVAFLVLPISFHLGGYVYDFPELFFLMLAVALIAQRRWLLFYPLLVLAVLNKESNLLVALFTPALLWDVLPRRRLAAHFLVQLALGTGLCLALWMTFRGNPGGPVEFWLGENLRLWLDWRTYLATFSPVAALVRVPLPGNLLTFVVFGFGAFWHWRTKPAPLRRLVVAMLAVNVPLLLAFSLHNEIRNLSLAWPALYLALCHTVLASYGNGSEPLAAPASAAR